MARASKAVLAAAALALVSFAVWRYLAPDAAGSDRSAVARGGELIASLRSDPATYNRYLPGGAVAATDLVTLLVHARLIRINRATDQLEPFLAEAWHRSDDGLTYTLRLREGIRFSDGVPFTSQDALFSFQVAYDPAVKSPLRSSVQINGQPLQVSAPDPRTLVLRFPEPFAAGLRLLDNLPILPRHKLERALAAGTLADEWNPSKPLSDLSGLGPFVLAEHVSGQRLVFVRNPHYFLRDAEGVQLPYLDRLLVAIVPDQSAESLRLEAGETDLLVNGEIRPQDYAGFKRAADQGRLRLLDVGVGLDPDFLSFNLRPAKASDPRWAWLGRREFREAVSLAVNRQTIVDTVYLGAAVPISGPVSPGNRTWHADGLPTVQHEPARARDLLTSIGLRDANGDGLLDDARGAAVRFAVMTQAGHNRERVASVVQEQLRQVGIGVDIVPLDPRALFQRWSAGDYDAMYFGLQASSTDPWLNPELWLSSGPYHLWNPGQAAPATDWEARIDRLMKDHAGSPDLERRQQAFAEVQRILVHELPAIYFVAPRLLLAISPRVLNPTPALQNPQLLWRAESLAARAAGQ